ncbi:MAG: alginate export family protein [bacterium]
MSRGLMRVALTVMAALPLLPLGRAAADSQFDVSAQVRTRGEASDRTFLDDRSFQYTIFQRTSVRLDAKHGDGAEGVIEVQDSRIWGDEGSPLGDTHNVDLHQGFLRFRPGSAVTVQAGRQELRYGREFVLGDADFDNVGQAFDAVRLRADVADGWWDFLAGKVSKTSGFLDTGIDENTAATFFHHEFRDPSVEVEPFVLYRENGGPNLFETAFGGYGDWSQDRFSVQGDVVIEKGTVEGHDVNAYLVAADVALDCSKQRDHGQGLSVGFTKYTGDDPADPDDSAYDPLYADDHGYFGIMDIADSFANRLGVGLRDYHAKAWTELGDRVTLTGVGSVFRADIATPLGSGFDGHDLGQEVDVILRSRLSDGIVLEAGGGYFLQGDLIQATISDQSATWGYLQASGSF